MIIFGAGGIVLRDIKCFRFNKDLCKDICILMDPKYSNEDLKTAKNINKSNIYFVDLIFEACLTQ